MVGVKLAMMLRIAPATVTNKPDHRGEREGTRKNHCVRECRVIPVRPWWLTRVLSTTAHAATGATGTRHSPVPPWGSATPFVGRIVHAQLGRIAPRECGVVSRRHCEQSM